MTHARLGLIVNPIAGRGFGEIQDVDDDRRLMGIPVHAGKFVLRLEIAHPGARALAIASVWIEVPQADLFAAVAINHQPDLHVLVEDRHVGYLLEIETKELASHMEHAIA